MIDLEVVEGWPLDIYDRQNRPIGRGEYHRLTANPGYTVVRKTEAGIRRKAEVSTVWLGMNRAFTPDHAPLIFESMVFGGRRDGEQDRYSTESEALVGHYRMVRRVSRFRNRDVTAERIAEYSAALSPRAP